MQANSQSKRCSRLALAAAVFTFVLPASGQAGPGCMNRPYSPAAGYQPYGMPAPPQAYVMPGPYAYPRAAWSPRMGTMAALPARGGWPQEPSSQVPGSRATQIAAAGETAPREEAAAGDSVTVRISGMRFEPAQLTVKPGATVTWIQDSPMPHTVSGSDAGPRSGTLARGQRFSHTFEAPGRFDYACDFHPAMRGRVTVSETG